MPKVTPQLYFHLACFVFVFQANVVEVTVCSVKCYAIRHYYKVKQERLSGCDLLSAPVLLDTSYSSSTRETFTKTLLRNSTVFIHNEAWFT
jgi:hypothetical protein